MKVKFGDLTVRQLAELCNSHENCKGCPFIDEAFSMRCKTAIMASKTYLEFKIDLPDEEKEPEYHFPRFIDTGFGGE